MMSGFREYVKEYCEEDGKQEANLTPAERRGLKSLRKRVKEGKIVIIPTDKTGKLCVMERKVYEEDGLIHTAKDREIGWEEVKKLQMELNGNTAMMIKFFKMGSVWGETDRVRETMLNSSMSVCSMYLTFKDHKGWSWSKET